MARQLVLQYGWNSTCFQILNPGIERWISPKGNAVVGYVVRNDIRVVAGAPVCALEDLEEVIRLWEEVAEEAGHGICYFGAEGRMKRCLHLKPGYSTVSMGAQPSWNPQDWSTIFDGDKSLRAQRNRATNKGVAVSEWTCSEATSHPDLHRCLEEWLTTRGLPPMHFLVEPETLSCLEGRRIFVAEQFGEPVGFLVLSPVPERRGWLTEQFPRGFKAPNGTVEILMDTAIRTVGLSGSEYVTMGIIPLSRQGLSAASPNPIWLNLISGWVRAHGRRFYNFDGLDYFKLKFHPQQWEPIYVISKEDQFSFRSLYAIAAAFSDGSPLWAVTRGLGRAVQQEYRWIKESAKRKLHSELPPISAVAKPRALSKGVK
jgi:phosphatidylglycerol lysyltransferase